VKNDRKAPPANEKSSQASQTNPSTRGKRGPRDKKDESLDAFREVPDGTVLTTDQGIPIPHTDDSLKGGPRGPSLLEDFHLREKITRFDHERIPERVVHARGSAAHGHFQVYESLAKITKAKFLQDPSRRTPVFVRFSTVAGSRGSADTARDVRGFATKFYTDEGNFDLVGNNMPVFFIQDGIKFPDLIHAVKPEPNNEMPGAASAHDSFYDFVGLVPETAHMLMWIMSDRAIPRSLRMMEGFGVHTFRLVNDQGKSQLVKFHWKPVLGMHSLVWDEAQKIAGKDGDFHRRDLWDAIESGAFPEWELGLQIIDESDAEAYGFDMLDPTKLLPEELVPVKIVGKMTLDRNPDNFFAETEQVAFCVSNLVSGIDVTNDPLMQARLFSYLDTQLTRLGGPNHAELPINRPVAPMHNHQQDGFGRQAINTGKANYHPNSIGGGCPMLASPKDGGYVHFPERVSGEKTRARSESFKDHFSQATLFFKSLSAPERMHLTDALRFELGKVERKEVRERVVREVLANIDAGLAKDVASVIDVAFSGGSAGAGAAKSKAMKPTKGKSLETSPALSMQNPGNVGKGAVKSRKIAVLIAPGFAGREVDEVKRALEKGGAAMELVAPKLGPVKSDAGDAMNATKTFLTAASVLYDAVYVPGGKASVDALNAQGDAVHFVLEAFRHCKAIGASGEGVDLLARAGIGGASPDAGAKSATKTISVRGVVRGDGGAAFAKELVAAIAQHRHWERDDKAVPA
jgi:catalase